MLFNPLLFLSYIKHLIYIKHFSVCAPPAHIQTHTHTPLLWGTLPTDTCPGTHPQSPTSPCWHVRGAQIRFLIICLRTAECTSAWLVVFPLRQTLCCRSQCLSAVPVAGPRKGRDCVLLIFEPLAPRMVSGT